MPIMDDSNTNFFQMLRPVHVKSSSSHRGDSGQKTHEEYVKLFVNPRHVRINRELKESPISAMFLKETLGHIFKWLEFECSPENKRRFFDIMESIYRYQPNDGDAIVKSTSDGIYHMITLYAPKTFTDEALLKVAAWLRMKATAAEKLTFKNLMRTFHTFRSGEFHSLTTTSEGFQHTPLYVPDKTLSRSAHDIARRLHREKFRPIIQTKQNLPIRGDGGAKLTMRTSYKDSYSGASGAPSAPLKPLPKKEPYGVLNEKNLKTTNQQMYPYWGKLDKVEKVTNSTTVTASIGASTPSWSSTLNETDLQRLSAEKLELSQSLRNRVPLASRSDIRMNYTTEMNRAFLPQKMYRESEKRAYEHARNPKRQTPFAHTYSGFALPSMLQTQTQSVYVPQKDMLGSLETRYNRKKVPFYLQTVK